jgi:hypothetical protein
MAIARNGAVSSRSRRRDSRRRRQRLAIPSPVIRKNKLKRVQEEVDECVQMTFSFSAPAAK